jgi:hypothetical protein
MDQGALLLLSIVASHLSADRQARVRQEFYSAMCNCENKYCLRVSIKLLSPDIYIHAWKFHLKFYFCF